MSRFTVSLTFFTLVLLWTSGCTDQLSKNVLAGFTIGLTVSGSQPGLVLGNADGEKIEVDADGTFFFAGAGIGGSPYEILVKSHPNGQSCSVLNGKGVMPPDRGVVGVEVKCVTLGVTPVYQNLGAKWNDYVRFDGADLLSAKDLPCNMNPAVPQNGSFASCIHGGELRQMILPDLTSCDKVTAEDSAKAFNWACDKSTGTVRLVSLGLKPEAGLATLIDFDAIKWKDMSLSVSVDGSPVFKSNAMAWWSNPVTERNMGGFIPFGVIAVATLDPLGPYLLNGGAALVVRPNVRVRAWDPNVVLMPEMVSITGAYNWVEGDFYAKGANFGIHLIGATHSQVRNTRVYSSLVGVRLDAFAKGNLLTNIVVANNIYMGVSFWQASQNTIAGLSAHDNHTPTYSYTVAAENGSLDNTIMNAYLSAGANDAVFLDGAHSTALLGATITNNQRFAVRTLGGSNQTFAEILAANNGSGISIGGPPGVIAHADNQFFDIASLDNGGFQANLALFNLVDTRVMGSLRMGLGNNCGSTASLTDTSGILNGPCTDTGAYGSNSYGNQLSSAFYYPGGLSAKVFVGRVFTDDSVNSADFLGLNSAILDSSDWAGFESTSRSWGRLGFPFPPMSAFPAVDQQGACGSALGAPALACRIWDWALSAADLGDFGPDLVRNSPDDLPFVLGRNDCPSGDTALLHQWSVTLEADCDRIAGAQWFAGSGSCKSTYLPNADEINHLSLGNHNGFCESGEVCLMKPNAGAYQGHGTLVKASSTVANTEACEDIGSGGDVTDVELYKYSGNGR